MEPLSTLRELFNYSDTSNRLVLTTAGQLSDEQLDHPLDLGPGSIRRICRHLLAGEATWLRRIQGVAEARWPDELQPMPVSAMLEQLETVWTDRDRFLDTLPPEHLTRTQSYRDSKGSLFQASLHEMLIQSIVHSIHHRAQIANGLRRTGGQAPNLDYMYLVRRPLKMEQP
jgi:uncharacterized damage-inducible protein DinB